MTSNEACVARRTHRRKVSQRSYPSVNAVIGEQKTSIRSRIWRWIAPGTARKFT